MIQTPLRSLLLLGLLGTVAQAAPLARLSSHQGSNVSIEQQGAKLIRIASGEDGDMDPEEMEAALAKEQARQDAMEDLERQVSAPLGAFSATYEKTLQARDEAVQKAAQSIDGGGCNLMAAGKLMGASDEFVASNALKAAKKDVDSLRSALTDKASFYKVTFTSSTPPDTTAKVLSLLSEAAAKIKGINAEYSTLCASYEQQIAKIPVTDGAKMMAVSSERLKRESEMSAQVQQLVDNLNKQIDAADAPLIAWAVQPLKSAQPKPAK